MKRKILTMITIGCIFLMAVTGCGDSSGNRSTSDRKTKSDRETTSDRTIGSDAATKDEKERPDDSEGERESKKEPGINIDNFIFRNPGLYQSDGSFISWDDLGIDVETDYDWDNYETEAKSPYKVFTDNDYDGELVLPDNITSIGNYVFIGVIFLQV